MKKLQLTMKVFFLIGLTAALFAYAMFQGGFVSWFLFYATSTVVVFTLIFAVMPIGTLEITRKVNAKKLASGEKIQVTLLVTRKNPFPFLFFIVEDVMEGNFQTTNKQIIYPFFKRKLDCSYSISDVKRGYYQFSKVKLKTSDFFGLFEKEKEVIVRTEVIVYPNFQPLNTWEWSHENDANASVPTLTQSILEDISSVAGSREYIPGDRLTSIDWKVTARVDKLMTKEFEQHVGQRMMLVVNGAIEKDHRETFEKALELAASFIVHNYQHSIQTGLITLSEEASVYPIQVGERHQESMLMHLAKLNGQVNRSTDSLFSSVMTSIHSDTIVLVIGAKITDLFLEKLELLFRKGVTVIFCYVKSSSKLSIVEETKINFLKTLTIPCYIIHSNYFKVDFQGGKDVDKKQ